MVQAPAFFTKLQASTSPLIITSFLLSCFPASFFPTFIHSYIHTFLYSYIPIFIHSYFHTFLLSLFPNTTTTAIIYYRLSINDNTRIQKYSQSVIVSKDYSVKIEVRRIKLQKFKQQKPPDAAQLKRFNTGGFNTSTTILLLECNGSSNH